MFDVFYFHKKPNLFPHEQQVDSIEQALQQCRTRYCWIINYLIDYSDFDWNWEPVHWQAHQRHVWSTTCQLDSGTWLLPKLGYHDTNYHNDVYLKYKNINQDDPVQPLDVIFISNGEPNAEQNYQHLQQQLQGRQNRLVRINGIQGRVRAYHAAAQASQTVWAFCVFAKLWVDENFDWNWQPDYYRSPRHYIFYAKNPINHLEYGHQALIAYHKQLTLDNPGLGLDFTLDQPNQVVPVLSGIAYYNLDPWTTWRTAFRECIKLQNNTNDSDSQYRLQQWLTQDHINDAISRYSILGAQDAVKYHQQVNGDLTELKKSYEWAWLAQYAVDIGRLCHSDIHQPLL